MNKLKVGDRVAVHGFDSNNYFNEGSKGTVLRTSSSSTWVAYDDKDFPDAEVHTKQCRKLTKKGSDKPRWESAGWSGAV